jgi:peptidoglycan/LPS O-acetylase OafA/YrhL
MSEEKIYFKNLDALRFIAALMVFLRHGISPCYEYLPIKNNVLERVLNTLSSGGAGVTLFFVLSGFLITFLLLEEHDQNGRIALKKFYFRRALRIWPLYFLVLLFTFFLYPFLKELIGANNPLCSNIWYHVSFLSNFDVIHIESYCAGKSAMSQNITWSISVEEQFYLFWPLLFILLPQSSWGYSILIVIAVSLGFRILNFDNEIVLYYHTLSSLFDLAIGGMTAYVIRKSQAIKSIFEKTSTGTHIILFVVCFSCMYWSGGSMLEYKYGPSLFRVSITLSMAMIIAAQAFTKSQSPMNLHNFKFANKWGKYTYGIYLLHAIVLTLLNVIGRMFNLEQENFGYLLTRGIIAFVLTLMLSKMSYDYIESKFLRLKKYYTVI